MDDGGQNAPWPLDWGPKALPAAALRVRCESRVAAAAQLWLWPLVPPASLNIVISIIHNTPGGSGQPQGAARIRGGSLGRPQRQRGGVGGEGT